MLLTIVLWASLPAIAVFAGRLAGAICAVVLVANAAMHVAVPPPLDVTARPLDGTAPAD